LNNRRNSLRPNDLGLRGGGGIALSPYVATTYDDSGLFLKIF